MVQLSDQNTDAPLSKSFALWQAADLSNALSRQTADLRFDWRNELPVLVIHEAHKLSESSVRSLRSLPVVLIELSGNSDASPHVDIVAHSEGELDALLERIDHLCHQLRAVVAFLEHAQLGQPFPPRVICLGIFHQLAPGAFAG
ncbi:MAG: hypothetical protein CL430_06790, partial [Acidimicrobiaceae bacterium]|nr:hypothetical protein [Acidimicrobiaceae bacterium]